jgi:hypothetical protein
MNKNVEYLQTINTADNMTTNLQTGFNNNEANNITKHYKESELAEKFVILKNTNK